MGSYRMCLLFKRKFRVTEAGPPEDVKSIFRRYADGGTQLGAEQLRQFLVDVQGGGSETSLSDAERIVEEVLRRRHPIAKFTRNTLTLDDFHYYLFSADLNPAINDRVHHDMNAPLSHYFVYTGHNSYLTGNQLTSDSSDVPIIKALQRGVRVVELDIWPNSANDDVIVYHGRTLTSPVDLIICLRSIKKYAFSASPYPLIITLEDHLTPYLQAKVAKMLIQTFEGTLFYPESESLEEFPSPEKLKHRIIISTKPPKEYLEANGKNKRSNLEKEKDSDDDAWGKEAEDTAEEEDDEKSDSDASAINQDYDVMSCDPESCQLAAPEYKHLIAIHAGKPKNGLKEALKVEPGKVRRLSLSEQALEKAAESNGTDVVRFTQKNFLRIYPKGTRFNSSNYNPLIGWMHGAQMVAFNMQVKVFMGDGWHLDFKETHFDAYSPPDFYTRIGIAGVPADKVMKKTKVELDQWTPVWNEEFTFPLTVPELALLQIEVREYDMHEGNDFGGQTCLPVSELKTGIRAVPLYDRKGVMFKKFEAIIGKHLPDDVALNSWSRGVSAIELLQGS
ncbi:phosphoinositide phospholipase C 4-like isoform X4 [Carica papaya]|uniref:phosphoinositide phospholipase C 4-like isoform X4 n=1 Tax=Carica papaya TaxID=3649 RepID=UPI000B8D0846|nr:phosphoinositide phospholipase C 4-like isoform X4 [Carica papaya]